MDSAGSPAAGRLAARPPGEPPGMARGACRRRQQLSTAEPRVIAKSSPSHGRTRTEAGSTVTISDPAGQTTLVLDVAARTFKRLTHDQAGTAPSGGSAQRDVAPNQKLASPPRMLGKARIQGVLAEGREYTVTLPAHGKLLPARQKQVTLWLSNDQPAGGCA
jgi:hypothetical protein